MERGPALRVTVINPEAGTSALAHERLALLEAAVSAVLEPSPTLYLASAGFFGFRVEADRTLAWIPIASFDALRSRLETVVDRWSPHAYLAVGVDGDDGNDQRQWWFRGGHGRILEIERYRSPKPLRDRIVDLDGYRAIGFVCGEAYQHDEEDLMRTIDAEHVDLVAISAHEHANRVWASTVAPSARRWAFQRLFQRISSGAGAALAHAHGDDASRVRNCDNWFVSRGEDPFSGSRTGVRIEVLDELRKAIR